MFNLCRIRHVSDLYQSDSKPESFLELRAAVRRARLDDVVGVTTMLIQLLKYKGAPNLLTVSTVA